MMLIATVAAQATYAAPPASRQVPKAMIDHVVAMTQSTPTPTGTPDAPIEVSPQSLISTSVLIRTQRRTAEAASREGATSIVRPLTSSPINGCRLLVEHPTGLAVAGSKMLHGMDSLLQCQGFVASVLRQSFERPLIAATASGFPRAKATAIVDGKPLIKIYRRSSAGTNQVTYLWIAGNQTTTLSLTSESSTIPLMDRSAWELMKRLQ